MAITAENARELQQKSANARSLARAERLLASAQRTVAEHDGSFTGRTLSRVRYQIETLLDDIRDASDPQKIDRLASALARLNEIERQLAGRPMPGSLKPSSKPAKRSQTFAQPEPVDDSPKAPSVDWSDRDAPNG